MLKHRILTALVLVPFVVWGVLSASTSLFALLAAVVFLLCGLEWARLAGLDRVVDKGAYVVALAGLMTGIWLQTGNPALGYALVVVAGVWIGMTAALFLWRHRPLLKGGYQPVVLLFGLVLLPFAWHALVLLQGSGDMGPKVTLGLLVLIWLADSAAYFGGRRYGKQKLAPVLSPNKSFEGLYSALAAGLVWVIGMRWLLEWQVNFLALLGIALITILVSVAGDLFESMVKRRADEKDSGTILPGHGGVWDRIDSLVSSAPVFVVLLLLAGGIDA